MTMIRPRSDVVYGICRGLPSDPSPDVGHGIGRGLPNDIRCFRALSKSPEKLCLRRTLYKLHTMFIYNSQITNLENYNARRGKVLIDHLIQHLQIGFNKAARQLHIETQEEGRGRIAKRGVVESI